MKRGEIVRDAKGLKSLLSGEVRSTLNLTKINIDTFDTDEVGSLKMHVITDRELWKTQNKIDPNQQERNRFCFYCFPIFYWSFGVRTSECLMKSGGGEVAPGVKRDSDLFQTFIQAAPDQCERKLRIL